MSDDSSARAAPITVVTPTKDRAGLLAHTLRSIRDQTRPPEPGRLGVELCEVAISTLRERLQDLPRTVRQLLLTGTSRRAVLRRGARHFRARRRWASAGTRLWHEEANMRGWLAEY